MSVNNLYAYYFDTKKGNFGVINVINIMKVMHTNMCMIKPKL